MHLRSKKDRHPNLQKTQKGINTQVILDISSRKSEPLWMQNFRLTALKYFEKKELPGWGPELSSLDFKNISCYVDPLTQKKRNWKDVPPEMRNLFEKLGIPQAEQEILSGVNAQFESEVIYESLKEELKEKGVIFCSIETGLKEHPNLFKKYFASVVTSDDNKFAALNSALWSGGSFVYVPKNVYVEMPLQTYFRINTPRMGQFERTLIIADEESFVHYVEGCSAPVYRANSLHSAVVEIIAHKNAHVRYTTIQNWSNNVYNLVTKRAIAEENAKIEWVDGNFGSGITMKYPCIVLKGKGAKGQIISIALAGKGQQQDSGGKLIHLAPETTSSIISKSISKDGGKTIYRGTIKVRENLSNVKSYSQCDSLILDKISSASSFPLIETAEENVEIKHEATVSKLDDEKLFFLNSRGLSKQAAKAMIVNGFIDCFVKELPMEYAIEINQLIAMQMEESVG